MTGWKGVLIECVGLTAKEATDCMAWAFGENFERQFLADASSTWNTRHKHLFEIRGHEAVNETLIRIGRVYKRLFL